MLSHSLIKISRKTSVFHVTYELKNFIKSKTYFKFLLDFNAHFTIKFIINLKRAKLFDMCFFLLIQKNENHKIKNWKLEI